jgi:hypothetical protein
MPFVFNPVTGKLDFVNPPTTDASLLTSGTLADARLSSNVSLDNINNSFTAGQTITAAANTSALTATYSVTGANTTPILDLSGTWNTTGIARGIKLNITDTASAAMSLLADFQVGGSSVFSVDKLGILKCRLIQGNQTTISIQSTGGAAFTGGYNQTAQIFSEALYLGVSSDIRLFKDAANTLALRNGGTAASPVPQNFRVYNWQVDSSNYERGFMRWNSNILEIGTEAGGTGTARTFRLIANGNVMASLFGGTFQMPQNIPLGWSGDGLNSGGNSDTQIYRDAANILGFRNSANPYTLRVYGTYTSGTVFERLKIAATSTRNQIISESTGGTVRPLEMSVFTSASDPTSSNITDGAFGVWKNSTSGAVKLWVNDAGTMKSVLLI